MKRGRKSKLINLNIVIDKEIRRDIARIADETKVSMAAVIRGILELHFTWKKKEEEAEKQLTKERAEAQNG